MKTSIIVTTYNGKNYIEQQLASLLAQTLPADEVLIFDDGSTDGTIQLIQSFIAQHNLANSWHFHVNLQNKGFIRNFLDGAKQAQGEILSFCDQDDIWHPQKLSLLSKTLQQEDADAVYCLADTIDSTGNPIRNYIDQLPILPTPQLIQSISIEKRLKSGKSSGLCLAFNKRILTEVIQFSTNYQLPHDLPVGIVAAIHGKYYRVNKILVHHRVHTHNVSQSQTSILGSISNFNRQILSRQFKYRELWGIKRTYWGQLTAQEQKELDQAIKLTKQAIIGLKAGKISKLVPLLFTHNKMMNRLLALRNILSLVWRKVC